MLLEIALASSLLTPVALQEYKLNGLCGTYKDDIRELVMAVGQHKTDSGLGPDTPNNGQSIIELWENTETNTFSIVQRWANGNACFIMMGYEWKRINQPSL